MKSYDLHKILRIRTNIDFLPTFFETRESRSADLEIIDGKFDYPKENLKTRLSLSFNFFGWEKELFLEFKPGKEIFKLLLKNLEERTQLYLHISKLYTNFKILAKKLNSRMLSGIFSFFDPFQIIFLVLRIKLLQKNYGLIHAASFLKGRKAILLPAWPGVGKSRIIYELRKMGFQILSDEYIIISPSGRIFQLLDKGSISIDGRRIPFEFKNTKRKGKIKKIFFLKKGNKSIERKDRSEIVNMILTSSNFELQYFLPRFVFLAYCFVSNFPPDFIERKTREIVKKALEKIDCYVAYGNKQELLQIILENI